MIEQEKLLVPCPDCGEMSPEPIERLVENDVIPCSHCAGLIDLAADDCRPQVEQAKALLKRRPHDRATTT